MRYFEVPSRIVHLAFSPSATMRLAWGHAGSVQSSLTMPVSVVYFFVCGADQSENASAGRAAENA